MEEISSGANVLVSPLKFTWMSGLPPGPCVTVKGQCFMSACTTGSEKRRPMRRLASKTVLDAFIATWLGCLGL
jgi:hypothetical protein